ncbi:MAG: UDP-2,3-diacylglucosamine diphosphatase [Bacteroidota bacterium]|jgi:UDP-2,3-diacylglucosamine hydrolase
MGRIYFASDFHLGAPSFEESLVREKAIVAWLEEVEKDADAIYLVGDVFDFWFEYKQAVPRGFVRLLGKIASITDKGIPVHWFIGNHDMWIFDYLPQECGITLHKSPIKVEWNNKVLYIGHGDGLGPGDRSYKFLKWFFRSKFCQWAFARLHPNFGIALAKWSSGYSRGVSVKKDANFLGEDKEWLAIYAKEILENEHVDYFIFGHRHLPMEIKLSESSTYVNIGDWLNNYTYGVWNGHTFELKYWKNFS